MPRESWNPATGAVVGTHELDDDAAVEAALATAETAAADWRDRPVREREELLAAAAEVLRERVDEYADLLTAEMGKPLEQARSEIEKCAWVCEHYASHAGAYLADEGRPSPPGSEVRTVHEPLGPVLAVMP